MSYRSLFFINAFSTNLNLKAKNTQDIFGAGTDTTSSTLEWCMAEVMKNSETMAKAKAELKRVLGQGKTLEEADIYQLPYLRCIVKETLRLHPPLPLLLPRQIHKEAELNGYTIPRNSQVIVNAWAVGRDRSCEFKRPCQIYILKRSLIPKIALNSKLHISKVNSAL